MNLTRTQKDTLKAAVLAEPTMATPVAQANDQAVADWLNAAVSYVAWKTRLTEAEMHAAYVWTELDNLAQAKFNQLTLLLKPGWINPSLANVRQGILDIFATAALAATRAALIALAKRTVTRAEQLLATGTGTTGNPGTMGAEGTIAEVEAGDILRN